MTNVLGRVLGKMAKKRKKIYQFYKFKAVLFSKVTKCRQAPLDLVFVIDGSSSVTQNEFDKMVRFMIAISSKFEISPESARVGVVQYNYHQFTEIDWHDDDDKLHVAMTHLAKRGGGTYMMMKTN